MYLHIPDALFSILAAEFEEHPQVYALFDAYFEAESYCRDLVGKLLEVAKGCCGDTWSVRQLAVLMLHHQVLHLPLEETEAYAFLFAQLNLLPPAGSRIRDTVLREGFTTTDMRGFAREFKHRLERLHCVLDHVEGTRTTEEGLRAFIRLSRQPCKLTLARYLFTPAEVVDRIRTHVRISKGTRTPTNERYPQIESEAEHHLSQLPPFEAGILRGLLSPLHIYWVSDRTSAELNALVEYPQGTVVLVIKPPGSDLEIEIKRAGRSGCPPLSVIFSRNGAAVPCEHRLDGGSQQRNLLWDAAAASFFAQVYRLVHGAEAPISQALVIAAKDTAPVAQRQVALLDYFTEPAYFGEGYDAMREALVQSVHALREERGEQPTEETEEKELTAQFLRLVEPAQALLSGTSSFRLDLLARYLSPDGAEHYFIEGLDIDYTGEQARWFADEILEEVLGCCTPPGVAYRFHAQYVAAAYAVPENRARADQLYRAAMQQMGRFWGTLWAIGGYSNGESAVARNVGLKSCWERGQWQARLHFMDHDDLRIIEDAAAGFRPSSFASGMSTDAVFLLGRHQQGTFRKGTVDCLEEIYRVDEATGREGHEAFEQALQQAFSKTKAALTTPSPLQALFQETFLAQLRGWDLLLSAYLHRSREAPSVPWKEAGRTLLREEGYNLKLIEEFVSTVEEYGDFFERYAFLYTGNMEEARRLS